MVRKNKMPEKCLAALRKYEEAIENWVDTHVVYDAQSMVDAKKLRSMATSDIKHSVNPALFGRYMKNAIGAQSNRNNDKLYYWYAALDEDLKKKENNYKGAVCTSLISAYIEKGQRGPKGKGVDRKR